MNKETINETTSLSTTFMREPVMAKDMTAAQARGVEAILSGITKGAPQLR